MLRALSAPTHHSVRPSREPCLPSRRLRRLVSRCGVSTVSTARAGRRPTISDCLMAAESSLKLRAEHKLRLTRTQLLVCSVAELPDRGAPGVQQAHRRGERGRADASSSPVKDRAGQASFRRSRCRSMGRSWPSGSTAARCRSTRAARVHVRGERGAHPDRDDHPARGREGPPRDGRPRRRSRPGTLDHRAGCELASGRTIGNLRRRQGAAHRGSRGRGRRRRRARPGCSLRGARVVVMEDGSRRVPRPHGLLAPGDERPQPRGHRRDGFDCRVHRRRRSSGGWADALPDGAEGRFPSVGFEARPGVFAVSGEF